MSTWETSLPDNDMLLQKKATCSYSLSIPTFDIRFYTLGVNFFIFTIDITFAFSITYS